MNHDHIIKKFIIYKKNTASCQECFLTNAKLNIVLPHLLHSLVKGPYVD